MYCFLLADERSDPQLSGTSSSRPLSVNILPSLRQPPIFGRIVDVDCVAIFDERPRCLLIASLLAYAH